MKILDTITIKFKFKGFDDNPIAIATLNLNNEVEIRFCPIKWKKNRTGLFFDMPALKIYGYQVCAIILDEVEFKKLQKRVLTEFLEQAEEKYHPQEYGEIVKAVKYEEYGEESQRVNPEDIPL